MEIIFFEGLTPYLGTGCTVIMKDERMKTKTQPERLTIGEVAGGSGVNLETVRYYERRGLLPKPPRTASGYRSFPTDTVRRVKFIKHAQALGFTLTEIKELLALRVDPDTTCAQVRDQARAKVADIKQRIRSLEGMKKALEQLAAACRGRGPLNECPILESLDGEELIR